MSRWQHLMFNGKTYQCEMGSHCMYWNEHGVYLGQSQPDMVDGEGELFFSVEKKDVGKYNLTEDEMNDARERHNRECSPMHFGPHAF